MTAPQTTVSLEIPGQGCCTVTTAALSVTIGRYLPTTMGDIWQTLADRTNSDARDAHIRSLDIAGCLVRLADLDHNTEDSPLRVVAR